MGHPRRSTRIRWRDILDPPPISSGGGGSTAWADITGKPSTFPPTIGSTASTAVAGNDTRLTNARTPITHYHPQSDVTGLTDTLAGKASSSHGHATADVTGLDTALDGKAAAVHGHAIADTTGLQGALDGKAVAGHTHAPSEITGTAVVTTDSRLSDDRAPTSHSITALHTFPGGTTTFLRSDGTFASPASGSDPWTILKLTSDFTTSSATAVDVTGLGFTPVAGAYYMFESLLWIRSNTATVNPRPGLAWATGLTDGVASADTAQTATTRLTTNGNIAAPILVAAGGLPNTTQSWPSTLWGAALAGASPSGSIRIQVASETAGTIVTVKAGSYLRYRTY